MKNDGTYPKTLIISHNLIDDSNNIGKTLLSMLGDWPKEKLYSIYLRNEKPKKFFCSEYLLIDDKDVFLSTVSFGIRKSGVFFSGSEENNANQNCSDAEKRFYMLGNKRKPIVSWLRDTMWHLGFWKNRRITDWVKKVSPDLIVFIPNDYNLAFDVLKFVHKVCDVPVITIYTDDAFYYGQGLRGIDKIRRKKLLKNGHYVANISNCFFTASKEMSEEYEALFGKKCHEFGNYTVPGDDLPKRVNSNLTISYIGNLHSKRWESICDIGNALDVVNEENGLHCTLNVYSTSMIDDAMKNCFCKIKSLVFCGALMPDDVRQAQLDSDILVHVESFDKTVIKSTRLSVSTKIFEYLTVGRPILAYGPEEVSSMKLLLKTGGAVTCFSKDELVAHLSTLLKSSEIRESLADKGKQYAERFLNKSQQASRFREVCVSALPTKNGL